MGNLILDWYWDWGDGFEDWDWGFRLVVGDMNQKMGLQMRTGDRNDG